MAKFLFLFLTISSETLGQNIIQGHVLSLADNKPIPNFAIRLDRKKIVYSDSTGLFAINTKKHKLKFRFSYSIERFTDTVIYISDSIKSIKLYTTLTWDSLQAKYDIEHDRIVLFCCFGFVVVAPSLKDEQLERKFGFRYYVVGDAPPAPIEKLRSYNAVVAKYLDKKYGPDWKKEGNKSFGL